MCQSSVSELLSRSNVRLERQEGYESMEVKPQFDRARILEIAGFHAVSVSCKAEVLSESSGQERLRHKPSRHTEAIKTVESCRLLAEQDLQHRRHHGRTQHLRH